MLYYYYRDSYSTKKVNLSIFAQNISVGTGMGMGSVGFGPLIFFKAKKRRVGLCVRYKVCVFVPYVCPYVSKITNTLQAPY